MLITSGLADLSLLQILPSGNAGCLGTNKVKRTEGLEFSYAQLISKPFLKKNSRGYPFKEKASKIFPPS